MNGTVKYRGIISSAYFRVRKKGYALTSIHLGLGEGGGEHLALDVECLQGLHVIQRLLLVFWLCRRCHGCSVRLKTFDYCYNFNAFSYNFLYYFQYSFKLRLFRHNDTDKSRELGDFLTSFYLIFLFLFWCTKTKNLLISFSNHRN